MKNSLKKYLLPFAVVAMLCPIRIMAGTAPLNEASDSVSQANRTWHKLSHKMHRFTYVLNAYVKAVVKAKPEDTNITSEALSYSDSVNKTLRNAGPTDSSAVKKVETLFDSLVQASVRLVRKVESDSSFVNNRAVKHLSSTMLNIRESVNKYQNDLNESATKRREKRQSIGGQDPASSTPTQN
jgi:hypothetical protein